MKKKLSILLAASMVLSMVPVTSVFARTDNKVATTRTITDDSDEFIYATDITFEVKDSQSLSAGDEFMLTISGAEFASLGEDDELTRSSVSGFVYYNNDDTDPIDVMEDAKLWVMGKTYDTNPIDSSIKMLSETSLMVKIGTGNSTANDTLKKLQMPVYIKTTGSTDGVKITVDGRDTKISSGSMEISQVTSGDTVAKTTTIDLAPGDTEELNSITIDETVASGADIDELIFTTPSGFTWVEKPTEFSVEIAGGYSDSTIKSAGWDDDDDSTFVIKFDKTVSSSKSNVRGIIIVNGLELSADTDAKIGDVNIKIKGDATSQSLLVAECVEYAVSIDLEEEVPTLIGGRFEVGDTVEYDAFDLTDEEEHETAEFTISENTADSWFSGRSTTFVVPEGVKFVAAEVTSVKNLLSGTIDKGVYNLIDKAGKGSETVGDDAKFKVSEDGTKLTMSGVKGSTSDNVKAELGLKFSVSISPDFEGDVVLTVGNSIDDQDVVIAKAVTPITAKFETTNAGIAYKDVSLSKITIVENAEAALIKDGLLTLAIDDVTDPNIEFVTDGDIDFEITDGDIDINKVYVKNGFVYVDIKRESTVPSTIVINGLKATLDRTPAEGDYSLVAFGDAVFANNFDEYEESGSATAYDGLFDDIDGIEFENFVNVTTAAPDKGTSTTNKVAVTIGSNTYTVNGVVATLDSAPIAQNNRTLVPTRAISEGLGYQVLWNDATKTATVVSPDNRTAAFTMGSNIVVVNGAGSFTMDVVPVATAEGRMLVPFRALGDALGIDVTWDAATNTATYN